MPILVTLIILDLNTIVREKTEIIAKGRFKPEDIDCWYIPLRIPFSDQEKESIENEWKKAKNSNPSLFDGQLFHVQDQKFNESKIILSLYLSSFKEYIGTERNKFNGLFGSQKSSSDGICSSRIVKPLSTGTMIITSDEKWIIGRRHGTYDYQGFYALIGGYMDPAKDIINSRPDPFFAMKRELKEERGIEESNIDDIICLGLDIKNSQPYLAFTTRLTIPIERLELKQPNEREFIRFEHYNLTGDAIKHFLLNNHDRVTPHAIASMLMYIS